MKSLFALFLLVMFGCASPNNAPEFNSIRWLDDFNQIKNILSEDYPNLEATIKLNNLNLPQINEETISNLKNAKSDLESRIILEAFVAKFADPHFKLVWPGAERKDFRHSAPELDKNLSGAEVCKQMSGKQKNSDFLFALPNDFKPLGKESPYKAGTISSGRKKIGIIRIHAFGEDQYVDVCVKTWDKFRKSTPNICRQDCWEAFDLKLQDQLLVSFEKVLRQLIAQKIEALIIDITGNGGGTNWEESIRAMVTNKNLICGGGGQLKPDRKVSCDRKLIWVDKNFVLGCSIVEKTPSHLCTIPNGLYSKPGIYTGPVFLLIDHGTASASEDFAARMQDNNAATIIGEPSHGAGCGYSEGGLDLRLKNSGVRVKIPNCVRYRLNGENELQSIQPDILLKRSELPGSAYIERVKEVIEKPNE